MQILVVDSRTCVLSFFVKSRIVAVVLESCGYVFGRGLLFDTREERGPRGEGSVWLRAGKPRHVVGPDGHKLLTPSIMRFVPGCYL